MSKYFTKSKSLRGRGKVELDLSNYADLIKSTFKKMQEVCMHQNLLKRLI